MIKQCFLWLVLILLSFALPAQDNDPFSETNLKKHVEFLSSDNLMGRSLSDNSPGLNMAADYIRQTLENNGVKPGADGYFQKVGMIIGKTEDRESGIAFTSSDKKVLLQTDSVLMFPNSRKTAIYSGKLVYAGFGWEDKETGHNDLKNLSLKNKVVLVSMGTPASFKEELEGKKPSFNYSQELEKANRILKKGARGVILIFSPFDDGSLFRRIHSQVEGLNYSFLSDKKQVTPSNIVLTPSSVIDNLNNRQGSVKEYLENTAKEPSAKAGMFAGISALVSVPYTEKEIPPKNVVGVVEGSDPVMKNECLVYMAHYDHLGVDKSGDVFNGADDNASGCAVLLELARKFNSLEVKPKRSILFLWVTGEETGMFGSRYYVANPLFPLDKTIACINLDMVGRVFEPRDTAWKTSPKMVKDFDGIFALSGKENPWLVDISDAVCQQLGLIPDKSLPSSFLRSSDHYQFYIKGVPILNYATGYHADYHKPTDEFSKINFQKMKRVADLCFEVGSRVANLPALPANPSKKQ